MCAPQDLRVANALADSRQRPRGGRSCLRFAGWSPAWHEAL